MEAQESRQGLQGACQAVITAASVTAADSGSSRVPIEGRLEQEYVASPYGISTMDNRNGKPDGENGIVQVVFHIHI